MSSRLDEVFSPGDPCEVYFADAEVPFWRRAIVWRGPLPVCWVKTADGGVSVVTNTRRLRTPTGAA